MMKTIVVAALALLFYVTSTAHADDTVRMIGWVSDGHCTVDHMKEGGAACVRKCIAGATHVNPDWKPGGMVLVTEDKKVWKVDNADALWGLESRRVEITATRNDKVGSVKVMKVLSPKK
ncbi:MAG: hypothetical protein AUH72_10790 [Acidobacteria bacterium 13_1_40CM_4_65_8]|nr:MAG: hypothetical protein AUH72_10790 [Acidobacteria bacterium 13_1_40CM_4_65_8]